MSLAIADRRIGPSHDAVFVSWLDENVSAAFKLYFGRHGHIPLEMQEEVLEIFDGLVESGDFLACDCRGSLLRPPMVTAVVKERGAEGGHVRVLDKRPVHGPDCQLAQKGPPRPNRVRPPTNSPLADLPLAILRPIRQAGDPDRSSPRAAPPDGAQQRAPRRRGASLAQLMMLLCEWGGLNRLRHDDQRFTKAQRLRVVLEKARGEICPGHPLRDWLAVRPKILGDMGPHTDRTALSVALKNPSGWPPGCRPQGFFLDSFGAVEGCIARDDHFHVEIKHRPSLFHYPDAAADGPLLGLVVISQLWRNSPYTDPVIGYFHPCYSHASLFPVDSRQESATLDVLRRLQANPLVPAFDIWKPLFDLEVPGSDCKVRPDFIIELCNAPQQRIVVETMGMRTEDYEPDKERQHELMSKLGAQLLRHERRVQGEAALAHADLDFQTQVERWLLKLA